MNSRIIAEWIVYLGRLGAGEGPVEGLTQVQWTALRYFARANRFSRTPSAFAEFHATTRGTASQTIKGLIDQEYLVRTRSQSDGRSIRLDLSDKARRVLARDPLISLAAAADALPPGVRGQLAATLQRMLRQVADQAGKPLFGTCETCVHLNCETRCQAASYDCAFLDAPLAEQELDELCINFAPGKPMRPVRASDRRLPS